MPKRTLTTREILFLQQTLNENFQVSDIRLREGEYQYELSKGIASFQLEQQFPNVKDLIQKLYGEEKTNDIQFIRKIQTILKKMEKRKVINILPKKKPWELQRYGLLGFKFEDSGKNRIVLATEQQIEQAKNQLQTLLNQQGTAAEKQMMIRARIYTLILIIVATYILSTWTFTQPKINLLIFVPAFSIAAACSLLLGRLLSKG